MSGLGQLVDWRPRTHGSLGDSFCTLLPYFNPEEKIEKNQFKSLNFAWILLWFCSNLFLFFSDFVLILLQFCKTTFDTKDVLPLDWLDDWNIQCIPQFVAIDVLPQSIMPVSDCPYLSLYLIHFWVYSFSCLFYFIEHKKRFELFQDSWKHPH